MFLIFYASFASTEWIKAMEMVITVTSDLQVRPIAMCASFSEDSLQLFKSYHQVLHKTYLQTVKTRHPHCPTPSNEL